MKKGSTPVHVFELPISTDEIANATITYKQGDTIKLKKELKSCTYFGNTIKAKLSQAESLCFNDNSYVKIQLHVLTTTGDAFVSDVYEVFAEECLDCEVLT